jgi:phosphoribosylformylglycinamidine synthase
MPDSDLAVRSAFAREDDTIWLLGAGTPTVSGSEFLSVVYDIEAGSPPDVDMHAERSLNEVIIEAAAKKLLRSAHDVSDGGLAVCLAESCISGFIGATVSLPVTALRVSNSLFGESGARVVVSRQRGIAEVDCEREKCADGSNWRCRRFNTENRAVWQNSGQRASHGSRLHV